MWHHYFGHYWCPHWAQGGIRTALTLQVFWALCDLPLVRKDSSCHLLKNIMQRLCSVQCRCPQTPSSVVALLSGLMWCREVGSVMTSPDLLADSYRDNDDYCFTRVYGFNLNKNECRNITHAATSARCDVGRFPSIRGLYYVYFKTSVMC